MKSAIEETDDKNSKIILENLDKLESKLSDINNDTKFEEFKTSLTFVLNDIAENAQLLNKNQGSLSENINSVL